jgi:PAS domain S-box-containing protein
MTSERRTTEDRRGELGVEHERLRTIVERVADGILIVDDDGVIRFANPAATQMFGRSAEELVGRDLGFPVVTDDKTEIELLRPNGGSLAVEFRVANTDWAGDRAYLVSLRDVSERRAAEEQAAQLDHERIARAKAEAANHAKSEFLTLMSHELRTPINAVIGYSDLLNLDVGGKLGQAHRQYVSRIGSSGRHLLSLVNELLDLARVDSGDLTLVRGTGDAESTANEAASHLRDAAIAQDISLAVRPASRALRRSMRYEGDADRVRQILESLLSNALKFTQRGGAVTLEWSRADEPANRARLSGQGPWVIMQVADNGIGIALEQSEQIFDPFVQLEDTHTRTKEGAGLGLALSRRLARLMHGDLTVESTVGKGSTFTLWLRAASDVDTPTG